MPRWRFQLRQLDNCMYIRKKKKNLVPRCRLSWSKQRKLLDFFLSGCSARDTAARTFINRNTATLFFRKLRRIIAKRQRLHIVGEVEVDETYLSGGGGGRKKARRGRSLDGKIALVGVVQRGTRNLHIEEVKATDAKTLESFCHRNIACGSTVHTDCFRSYNHIEKYGFIHKKVNHFLTFKNWKTKACTNLIESVWSYMKRFFCKFCGGWRNNLNLWLAQIEFLFESGSPRAQTNALKRLLRNERRQGAMR